MFDMENSSQAIVVGGGAAGLSTALMLGRCRRTVIIIDDCNPRNASSNHMHAFISRDGCNPNEFLSIAREQLIKYATVKYVSGLVEEAEKTNTGFKVKCKDGSVFSGDFIVFATGELDVFPQMNGFFDYYGHGGYHHCSICDGFEYNDKRIVVIGEGEKGSGMALEMSVWSKNIVLVSPDLVLMIFFFHFG